MDDRGTRVSEAEVREAFGPWSVLAASAVVAVVDPADRPSARLLSVLVAFADACAARLRALATDAQLLLGPQRTAVSLVEEVRSTSPGSVRRTQLLQAAEEELGRAVRAAPSHEQRALLQLQQALMAVALSDVEAELHWIREARRSTALGLEESVMAAQRGSHQLRVRLVDTRAGGVRSRSTRSGPRSMRWWPNTRRCSWWAACHPAPRPRSGWVMPGCRPTA